MNAYIYHPDTGTYLNPFETYLVEAPEDLSKEDFEKLLVGDPDDWDVNGPLGWESYIEKLPSFYEVAILDIDIEDSLKDTGIDSYLTKENAEYLNKQSFVRKHILCREITENLIEEDDFRGILRVIVNEVVSRYRKYDEVGKTA